MTAATDAADRRCVGGAAVHRRVGQGEGACRSWRTVDSETAAVDYVNGPDGLLMAPTYAVPRLLERNGLTLQDFDFTRSTRLSPRWCWRRWPRGSPTSTASSASA